MLPIREVSRPAVLEGQANGQLDSILIDTPAVGVAWPVRLVVPATRAWRALTAAAAAEGHILKPSGPVDSYRPYSVQERIFRARYVNYDTGNGSPRLWQGLRWWRRDGVAAAAVPGTSNHGWGLAVDVGEERDGDTGTESIDTGTLAWLVAHEQDYGFSHELQSEPWHIRYFAGDDIPDAVAAFEQGRPAPAPTPAPPPAPSPTPEVVDVDLPVLRRDDRRTEAVKSLQALLNVQSGSNLKTDGDFGYYTDKRVREVQAFCRLDVDGIVGRDTWGVLFL